MNQLSDRVRVAADMVYGRRRPASWRGVERIGFGRSRFCSDLASRGEAGVRRHRPSQSSRARRRCGCGCGVLSRTRRSLGVPTVIRDGCPGDAKTHQIYQSGRTPRAAAVFQGSARIDQRRSWRWRARDDQAETVICGWAAQSAARGMCVRSASCPCSTSRDPSNFLRGSRRGARTRPISIARSRAIASVTR